VQDTSTVQTAGWVVRHIAPKRGLKPATEFSVGEGSTKSTC